jgi:hypothetical protein
LRSSTPAEVCFQDFLHVSRSTEYLSRLAMERVSRRYTPAAAVLPAVNDGEERVRLGSAADDRAGPSRTWNVAGHAPNAEM